MKMFKLQDIQTGIAIDNKLSHPEALARVADYNKDREIYEVVEDDEATIQDIAAVEGLAVVATTSAPNGYPLFIQNALTGFENWEEAQQVAKVYDLQLIWLQKRDGWDLWHRSNTATHPLDITEDCYGDDYRFYKNVQEVLEDEQETIIMLIEDEVKEHVITHTLKCYAADYEPIFRATREQFFDMVLTDGEIDIRVIQTAQGIKEEGIAMHHCVGNYYNKSNSLILSAKINGERIETIEVNLVDYTLVQSRGLQNKSSKYHQRIVDLVNANLDIIKVLDVNHKATERRELKKLKKTA